MHTLGVGTMREMRSVVTGLVLPSLRQGLYAGREDQPLRGKAAMGVSSMLKEMLATDLGEHVTDVAVPVYFLHGVHDYTCAYAEASIYFDSLTAPLKGSTPSASPRTARCSKSPARSWQFCERMCSRAPTDWPTEVVRGDGECVVAREQEQIQGTSQFALLPGWRAAASWIP